MSEKVAIATGPGVTIGSLVLLGAFTGPEADRSAWKACEQHAGRLLHWTGVFGGYEALTGPAGTGYAVRILDLNTSYAFAEGNWQPVPLTLAR